MAALTCPACARRSAQVLPFPSDLAAVDYYRCECGHVWNVDKADPTRINHVTTLRHRGTRCGCMNDDDLVPFPFDCPTCGETMQFQKRRMGEDQPEPYRILIYFCVEHGFFRYSRHHAMVEGL